MNTIRYAPLVALLALFGCGGGSSSGSCKADADCKGSRICSGGSCVDPTAAGSTSSASASAASSSGGSTASSTSTSATSTSGGSTSSGSTSGSTSSTGSTGTSGSGSTSGSTGTSSASSSSGSTGSSGTTGCGANLCDVGGTCTADTTVLGCGPSCQHCNVAHATNSCDTSSTTPACTYTCGGGYCDIGGGCVTPDTIVACGASCTACPSDPNGSPACVQDSNGAYGCAQSCDPGFCPSASDPTVCAPSNTDADVNNCGTCGNVCPAHDANGNGTAACNSGTCALNCGTGMVEVNGLCQSNLTPIVSGTNERPEVINADTNGFSGFVYWANRINGLIEQPGTSAGTATPVTVGGAQLTISGGLYAHYNGSGVEMAWGDATTMNCTDFNNGIQSITTTDAPMGLGIDDGVVASKKHVWWTRIGSTQFGGITTQEYGSFYTLAGGGDPAAESPQSVDSPQIGQPGDVVVSSTNFYWVRGYEVLEVPKTSTSIGQGLFGDPFTYSGIPSMKGDGTNLYFVATRSAGGADVVSVPYSATGTGSSTIIASGIPAVALFTSPTCAGHVWVATPTTVTDYGSSGTGTPFIYYPNITGLSAACGVDFFGNNFANLYLTTWDPAAQSGAVLAAPAQ